MKAVEFDRHGVTTECPKEAAEVTSDKCLACEFCESTYGFTVYCSCSEEWGQIERDRVLEEVG